MIVPTYWAEARAQHLDRGQQVTILRFGWSDTSLAEAQAMADVRAEDAIARFLQGESLPRREHKVTYNGAEGLPIREEVLERHGNVVITRNIYGARCLNVPDVLFADVDFLGGRPGAPGAVSFALAVVAAGIGGYLFGWKVAVVVGIVAFYLAERFWISPKVEEADPERLQELEHAASEKLHDLREEIQEHIPFKQHRADHKKRESDGD